MKARMIITLLLICISCKDDLKSRYDNVYLEKLLIIAKKSILDQYENRRYDGFVFINNSGDDIGIALRIIEDGNKERGCIAFIKGAIPLERSVGYAAINAAFFDERFKPVGENDFDKLYLEVSVFGKFSRMRDFNDFKLGKESVMVNNYMKKAIIQAQIATEEKDDKEHYLERICIKAGMEPDEYTKKGVILLKSKTVFLRKKFSEINIE